MLVAVYGTLRKGGSNHYLLREAEFVGCEVLSGYKMYSVGLSFPAIVKSVSNSDKILVEYYLINELQLSQLDDLEGYSKTFPESSMYIREKFVSDVFGECYIYEYNNNITNLEAIKSGDWLNHKAIVDN